MGGVNPNHNLQDLFESIDKGDFPSWTAYVQVMTAEEAENYRWNIFDMTKIWPHADFPLRQFGKLTLDQVVGFTPCLLFLQILSDGNQPPKLFCGDRASCIFTIKHGTGH
jgi:hypothetical protein